MLLLACTALGQTARVVLRWKATPGVSGYQVQVASDTGFSQIVLDEKVAEPVLKWESLPSTTFYWRVRSFDPAGRASEWSAARQIAPATGPPAPKLPADGLVLACSAEPIAFSLEPSAVLKEYVLELSPDGRFSASDTTLVKSTTGEFVVPLPVGAVSWRGRGVDLTGRTTEPSAARRISVRLAAPKVKPTADVAMGTASVTLGWAPAPCARRYVVEATHETPDKVMHEAPEPSMSFKPAGAGEYRFRVAARDDKGNQSDFSAESSFRVRLPAVTARGETLGKPDATGSDVELQWHAHPQAVAYMVELARGETFSTPVSVTTPTLLHRTRLAAGRYVWRVTARDLSGHVSFASEPRGFIVPDLSPPQKVALLFPIDGAVLVRPADGLIGVTWSKSENAVNHELDVDGVVQPLGPPPTRVALPDGEHVLRIRALGATGKTSEWSNPVRFYFGSPRVVSASAAFDRQPLRADGASSTKVLVRLLDSRGRVVPGAKPELSVDRGTLGPMTAEGEAWTARWRAPAALPADERATLTVTDGKVESRHTLLLAGDFSPFTLAGAVGGRFNGGAVVSPAGGLSVAYRPYFFSGLPVAEVRVGAYGASAKVQGPDGAVTARVTAAHAGLLVGAQVDLRPWTMRGTLGAGAQLAVASVGLATQTQALPSFEATVAVGRRLGPGAVEVELSFLYSRLNISLAKLQAGGLFVGIGYRFDLSGGR